MSAKRNPNLGPSHIRAKRRRLFLVRASIILFFILVLLVTLAIFSGHEKVKVENIVVSGNAAVSTESITTIAKRDMTGRYLYLFSRANSIIFPRFKIKADMLAEIKTVKGVKISWADWQTINIEIEERKPHSVWCTAVADKETMDSKCYFIDSTGFIYSSAPFFSGNLFIKNYSLVGGEGSPADVSPIGKMFLPESTYSQIYRIISILDENNIKIVSLSYDGFDYTFTTDRGPEIIFNKVDSRPFENLFVAIEKGELDLAQKSASIRYVDLRFDNKIVIGKKNE